MRPDNRSIFPLESPGAADMPLLVLFMFREFCNRGGRVSRILARSSYAVYLLHPAVTIVAVYILKYAALPVLVKFAAASVISLVVSFSVCWVLVKIPVVRRVL